MTERHELRKAFPLEPIPSSSDLTDSFGDDVDDDLSVLKGKRWDALQPHDFRFHFEVVCWLTPAAFRYYFPAIVNCSLNEIYLGGSLNETELVVDYTARLLIKSDSEDIENRSQAIWNAFSEEQMETVRQWIGELAKYSDALPVSSETLNGAIDERLSRS